MFLTMTTSHDTRTTRHRAFSLIEILIVTICLAIAALLVLPAVASTHGARLHAAGKLLAADLQYAQLRAMGNSTNPCMLVFTPGSHEYHLALQDSPATPITNPATNQPYVTTFGSTRAHQLKGVTFKALSVGGDDRLGFTSLGALDQSSDASITLLCGESMLTITIDAATGKPTLN